VTHGQPASLPPLGGLDLYQSPHWTAADKQRLAAWTGFPALFGQSRFALALRDTLKELQIGPEAVADETILVCPENFANRPVAAWLDVAGVSELGH
jgi:hypothetical protein